MSSYTPPYYPYFTALLLLGFIGGAIGAWRKLKLVLTLISVMAATVALAIIHMLIYNMGPAFDFLRYPEFNSFFFQDYLLLPMLFTLVSGLFGFAAVTGINIFKNWIFSKSEKSEKNA